MPSSITSSTFKTSVPTSHSSLTGWLREPLLHFLVLGGLLFAVDHVLASKADNPHKIVVSSDIDSEALQTFQQSRGREPTAEERKALYQIWVDNEVLYREGLAMQLDRGDSTIRERIIFKALSVIDAGVKLPSIDEKGLRDWFEQHREKYDEPARYNFQEAVLAGTNAEADIRSFVAALNNGKSGDTEAGLRVFKDRPVDNLVKSYGAEFPKALDKAPVNEWHALQTKDGWRAIRLDAVTAAKPAEFEPLAGVIMQDWKDATASEQRTKAVRALEKKYKVEFAPSVQAEH